MIDQHGEIIREDMPKQSRFMVSREACPRCSHEMSWLFSSLWCPQCHYKEGCCNGE